MNDAGAVRRRSCNAGDALFRYLLGELPDMWWQGQRRAAIQSIAFGARAARTHMQSCRVPDGEFAVFFMEALLSD